MTKHRQPEGRLGDEDVARNQFERRAGRIGDILVIAGRDDAQAAGLDQDLRRAEHVAGRMKAHGDAAEGEAFAVADRLNRAGKIRPIAQRHEIERLGSREHRAMARPAHGRNGHG